MSDETNEKKPEDSGAPEGESIGQPEVEPPEVPASTAGSGGAKGFSAEEKALAREVLKRQVGEGS